MKKLIYFVIITAFGLSSCSKDFLDRTPEASVSPDASFKTKKDLELYTNSFYNYLPSAEGIYNEGVDNIVKTTLEDNISGKRIVPTTGGGWSWGELRNINFFLENCFNNLSEAEAAPYAGVARFFRAYFYFEKLKRFGDVPWYGKTLSESDEEGLMKKRDPRTLIVDSILADLDYAIEKIKADKKSDIRITQWTALALKSRVALFEGTFRKYHTELDLQGADKLLEAAADAAKKLIDQKQYDIYVGAGIDSYAALFRSVNSIDQEVILTRKFSDALQIWHNVNYYTITASYGKPGLEKSLVNSYLMKDGSRFTDKPNYDKLTFLEEMKDRDPRLSQTIRYPGYKRIGGVAQLAPNFGNSVTGYQLTKFVGDPMYDNYNRSENDMPVIRYAEVLLNYAEARAELGLLTQADLDLSINKIRARIQMPGLNKDAANSNPDKILAADYPLVSGNNKGVILEIRRERRIELVMETYRWDDILRWKAGQLVTRQFKGMYFPSIGKFDLDGDGKEDVWIYEGTKPTASGIQLLKLGSEILLENGTSGNVIVNPHIKKVFDETKDYFYPLPTQELELNENLEQNPFWK